MSLEFLGELISGRGRKNTTWFIWTTSVLNVNHQECQENEFEMI